MSHAHNRGIITRIQIHCFRGQAHKTRNVTLRFTSNTRLSKDSIIFAFWRREASLGRGVCLSSIETLGQPSSTYQSLSDQIDTDTLSAGSAFSACPRVRVTQGGVSHPHSNHTGSRPYHPFRRVRLVPVWSSYYPHQLRYIFLESKFHWHPPTSHLFLFLRSHPLCAISQEGTLKHGAQDKSLEMQPQSRLSDLLRLGCYAAQSNGLIFGWVLGLKTKLEYGNIEPRRTIINPFDLRCREEY